jgi:hypothetical protein
MRSALLLAAADGGPWWRSGPTRGRRDGENGVTIADNWWVFLTFGEVVILAH